MLIRAQPINVPHQRKLIDEGGHFPRLSPRRRRRKRRRKRGKRKRKKGKRKRKRPGKSGISECG